MAARKPFVLIACLLALGACGKTTNPAKTDAEASPSTARSIDDAAIALVTEGISNDANSVPEAITGLLANASQSQGFAVDALRISVGGEGPYQIEGWMAERGLLSFLGDQYGRSFASLSPSGHALAEARDSLWYTSSPGPLSNIDCRAGETLNDATCTFTTAYTITPTAAGVLAGGTTKPLVIPIKAEVTKTSTGWSVSSIQADASQPRDVVLDSLLGASEVRDQQRQEKLAAWSQTAAQAASAPTSAETNSDMEVPQ